MSSVLWDRAPSLRVTICPRFLLKRMNTCDAKFYRQATWAGLDDLLTEALIVMYQNTRHPDWIHWGLERAYLKAQIENYANRLQSKEAFPPGVRINVTGFHILVVLGSEVTADPKRMMFFSVPAAPRW